MENGVRVHKYFGKMTYRLSKVFSPTKIAKLNSQLKSEETKNKEELLMEFLKMSYLSVTALQSYQNKQWLTG